MLHSSVLLYLKISSESIIMQLRRTSPLDEDVTTVSLRRKSRDSPANPGRNYAGICYERKRPLGGMQSD